MRIGIETMVQVILLGIACIFLVQIVGSNLYILQARSCFQKLVDQIEYSRNDEEVLEQCKEEALEQGYRLESRFLEEKEGKSCILLSLYYDLKVPAMISSEKSGETKEKLEGVIQGYAR
ncbi:MAG: hypothetical protein Q4F21_01035 [Lachnospiraceae bacterium]|nr:hypothetical protein [Lachnospiraceae bacterium]